MSKEAWKCNECREGYTRGDRFKKRNEGIRGVAVATVALHFFSIGPKNSPTEHCY